MKNCISFLLLFCVIVCCVVYMWFASDCVYMSRVSVHKKIIIKYIYKIYSHISALLLGNVCCVYVCVMCASPPLPPPPGEKCKYICGLLSIHSYIYLNTFAHFYFAPFIFPHIHFLLFTHMHLHIYILTHILTHSASHTHTASRTHAHFCDM
jgi:hypothetical protein